jgi:DNA repair exonuclease SbcCD ATPase subunit
VSTDQQISDYDASVSEYHASRARYIRTVTADTEKKLLETVAQRRDPLKEEINSLTALARSRYELRQTTLKAYAARAPGRVTAGGLLPPSPAERMAGGIDKLYKAAVKAAEEFNEVNDIIKKRKEKLDEIDSEVRNVLQQHGRDLIAQLETPTGLEGAFKRDPLLARAHARMLAAQARRESVRESTLPPLAEGTVMSDG